MGDVLKALWGFLNSPVGLTLVGGVVLFILNYIYSKKPEWQKFEGSIISAVKYAEQAIPDDTPSSSAKRFDEALKFVIKAYEAAQKKKPSDAVVASLKEGINIIHDRLEMGDTL